MELAACYRVFAHLGWAEMICNHITLRLPDSVSCGDKRAAAGPPQGGAAPPEGSEPRAAGSVGAVFLINPFGLHYIEVTARNFVKINLQGDLLDGSVYRVDPAGFVVHATIHGGIDGAHCVCTPTLPAWPWTA